MNKLFCENCKSIWYTSIESDDLTCDKCGAKLTKVEISTNKDQVNKKE